MAYADVIELARVLHLGAPSDAQGTALARCLDTAALEIDSECGTSFGTAPPALVVEVNIERAVEHWQQSQSAFGIVGLGGDSVPVTTARDSWERHAHKLAPLKQTWGVG